MKFARLSILSIAFLLVSVLVVRAEELYDKVINVSVTVNSKAGTGSGTLFTNDKGETYVLTAGHVVSGLKSVKKVTEEVDGKVKEVTKIVWEDAQIIQTLFEDDKEVGVAAFTAKVIAYSAVDEEGGLDLAVLKVVKKNFVKSGARFIKEDSTLRLGDDIIHVGSLYGSLTGSLVKGSISRFDYKVEGNSFTAADLGSRPGSSGGGVFKKEGDAFYYCGMLVRGDGAGVSLLKPTSVIRNWLKEQKLEFILTGK